MQAKHNFWRPNLALYPAGASAKGLLVVRLNRVGLFLVHPTFPLIYREPVEHLCFCKFRTFFH